MLETRALASAPLSHARYLLLMSKAVTVSHEMSLLYVDHSGMYLPKEGQPKQLLQ